MRGIIFSILFLTAFVLLILTCGLSAQSQDEFKRYDELKIFNKDRHSVVLSKYLNSSGVPCRKEFLRNQGLMPQKKKVKLIPYFTFSVSQKFINKNSVKPSLAKDAELLNLDFFLEKNVIYDAVNKAEIIWDGRVYPESGELIVGGYSLKYNEQPVANIGDDGEFVQLLKDERVSEFPLLKIPGDQIIFDPFKWTLLNISSTDGKKVKSSIKDHLPIQIKDKNGSLISNINYQIEKDEKTSKLRLLALIGNQSFEIASTDLKNYAEVKSKEAFRPELIDGCSQLGGDDVVTLQFKGELSKNVSLINEILVLQELDTLAQQEIKNNTISIDGDFTDWINIESTPDYEGDFVSYLFENPDSDLLEFKVTNDDKHLYLYSRVSGAHGRTGEKGRYYWYAYIDVDSDPSTGYPPTRDDNCYFGVAIGDDSEAQFEFSGNRFVKTFFGFTGIGAEEEVLSGKLELGPSYYSKTDENGNERDKYKIEYVNRESKRFITHDYTEGTSEDIIIALSPDGSQVEMKVELDGFLTDQNNNMLLKKGSIIDIAVGAECSSDYYGSDNWGADSTPTLYGYRIK